MNWLLWLAIVLVLLWIAAEILGWVLGAAMNLFWIVAIILFVVWLVGKVRRRV